MTEKQTNKRRKAQPWLDYSSSYPIGDIVCDYGYTTTTTTTTMSYTTTNTTATTTTTTTTTTSNNNT